jgi:hypothetical protein
MATTTISNRDFDVQILTEVVRGAFAQKDAFMGSRMVDAGAIAVNGQMTQDADFIGNEITVPYFGTLGEFVANADGNAITPKSISMTNEKGTVTRDSLGFEVSHWARNSGPTDGDPYVESARQILAAARRAMDRRCIVAAEGTPLIHDVFSSSSPQTLNYDVMVDGASKWGDENENVVGLVTHSRTLTDLRKLRYADGKPMLTEGARFNDVPMLAGVPVLQSDRAPLTGSTMGSVTSSGTTPPVATLSGTPLGAFDLVIECVVGGAHLTATIRFSTDGGNTWSDALTTAGVGAPLSLIDTATDSTVGVNGATGISVAFAAGTFATDNKWTAKSNLKVSTLVLKRGAMAFYYNRNALALDTDKNIYAHTQGAAMHLYAVAHRYRRVLGGTKPGVLKITHNVSGYQG